jgi:hypothetical protein
LEYELEAVMTFMDAFNKAASALRIQSDDPAVGELMTGDVGVVGSGRVDSSGDDIIISAGLSETSGIGLWDLVPDMVGRVSISCSGRGVMSDINLGVTPKCAARFSGTGEDDGGPSEIDSSAKLEGSFTVSG